MKHYIVPTTGTYYEEVEAGDAVSALENFVDNMDSDMGAYFKAVADKPTVIHGYEYPRNDYEVAMKIIADGEDASVDMSETEGIAALQRCYDLLLQGKGADDVLIAHFLHILEELTGCKPFFDEEEDDKDDDMLLSERICINGISSGEIQKGLAKKIGRLLDKKFIRYDYDSGDRLMVKPCDLEEVKRLLLSIDCTYSVVG